MTLGSKEAKLTVDLEKLRNYSLFGGIPAKTIQLLREQMREVQFKADETIFKAGSDGDEICFILEGSVTILAHDEVLAEFGEGEQFGEMHIIDIMPRSADVVGKTKGRFLAMNFQNMLQLRTQDPDAFTMLMMNCARDVSRRLRHMNDNYLALLARYREAIKPS